MNTSANLLEHDDPPLEVEPAVGQIEAFVAQWEVRNLLTIK
jgi:hypothetical protein